MRLFLDRLYAASAWAAAGCIFAIFAVVVLQVLCNLIDNLARLVTGTAFGLAIPSYSDFTGFFLAAASFLALARALREGSHIRVSLLIQALPKPWHRWFDFWAVVMAGLISIYFSWYSALQTFASYTYGDLSSGIVAVPLWIPKSAMTLGLIILSIALTDDAIRVLRGGAASFAGKGENLLGEGDAPERNTHG